MLFLLIAAAFHYWLFAVVGFHYLFTFAVVFCQLCNTEAKLIHRVVYNIVTPFVYIFDYCIDWIGGPNSDWYLIWLLPMNFEHVIFMLIGGTLLFSDNTEPHHISSYKLAAYTCSTIMLEFSLLIQWACYRYWYPKFEPGARTEGGLVGAKPPQAANLAPPPQTPLNH